LSAAGLVRESAGELGPLRALNENGPAGPSLIQEGLHMAKKKLKKGKKLAASKSLVSFNFAKVE
jgi:hypothetical protein